MEKSKEELLGIIQTSLATALEKTVELRPETKLRADLGVQSIDIIDFIFILEKALDIRIDLEEFFEFTSSKTNGILTEIIVSDVISFLERNLKKASL